METDLYHSKIRLGNKDRKDNSLKAMAAAPLLGYRAHLEQSWPEIADKFEIGFIEGTNMTEICISHSLGWENEDWLSFLYNGIALPVALDNCLKYGIQKFVFYCNDEIMEMSTEELKRKTTANNT